MTDTTPKPLLPFCGAPFLTGVVRRLAAVGVERVWLVVGADPRPFEAFAAELGAHGVEARVVPEPEPLDTAGGVRTVLEEVGGTFLVLNSDILTDIDLAAVIASHRRQRAGATLVLTRVEDTSTFGVCVLDGSRIVAFVEKPAPGSLPGQDTVNAGTYVIEPEILERFPVGRLSFEREVFPGLLDDGVDLHGWVGDGLWADLGTPERFLLGHRLALDGDVRWPSIEDLPDDGAGIRRGSGVEVADDARLHPPVLLLPGAVVGQGATVGPYAVIDRDVVVSAGASVRDSVLGPGTMVGPHTRLAAVLTGADARIGERVVAVDGVVVGDGGVVADGHVLPAGARIEHRSPE